jgi:hypothetical protein
MTTPQQPDGGARPQRKPQGKNGGIKKNSPPPPVNTQDRSTEVKLHSGAPRFSRASEYLSAAYAKR